MTPTSERTSSASKPDPIFTSGGCVVAFVLGLLSFPLFAASLGFAARIYRFTAGVPSP